MPSADAHQDYPFRGILYGLMAMLLLAIMYACSKLLSGTHTPIEIVFFRNIIALVPLSLYLVLARKTHLLQTKKPVALFFRVLIGAISLILTFTAFAMLPMANTTLILMTAVLIAPALAFFILQEHIGLHRWATIVIGLGGVAVMLQPTGHFETIGILVAFAAAFLQAVTQVYLRHLKTEPSFTVTFYFILGGAVLTGLFIPFVGKMPSPGEWPILLVIGFSGALAQYCLTSAFRSAPASVIAPLNYTGLIWASLLDIAVWKTIPGWQIFAGGAIIIASQAYILHREKMARNRKR